MTLDDQTEVNAYNNNNNSNNNANTSLKIS